MSSEINEMTVIAIKSELDGSFEVILHMFAEPMNQTHSCFWGYILRTYLTMVESHEFIIRLDVSSMHVEGLEVKRAKQRSSLVHYFIKLLHLDSMEHELRIRIGYLLVRLHSCDLSVRYRSDMASQHFMRHWFLPFLTSVHSLCLHIS